MKILIIGLPYFTKKLVKSLSDFDKHNIYMALDTYSSKIDKVKYLINIVNTDIIYSIGGSICNSKAIDIALFLGKKVIMHWVGTDVTKAINTFRNNVFQQDFINKVVHFCEVSWIYEELQEIGIVACIVPFVTLDNKIAEQKDLPDNFSILSYVGRNREEFYGINNLIKLANDFPNIEIKVVGISEYNKPYPANFKLLGWVDDMDSQYQECVLYLRLPEHDGLAFSVIEALANGRYVGYSHNYDQTFYIEDYSTLKSRVTILYDLFNGGFLPRNEEGLNFAENEFNKKYVLNTLLHWFLDISDCTS